MSLKVPLEPEIQARVQEWLDGPYDEATKKEIRQLAKTNPKALGDAFYTYLAFGTAGLRSTMGVGTNRINQYTIQMATQGLASYILKQPKKTKAPFRVVIGFDSRHHSDLYAKETARVLAANGIEAHLLKELRPTPFVSFCVRKLGCIAGVMITASHNPKEYNGYKVFWSDGGQVVSPHDTGIMEEANSLTSITQVKIAPLNSPLIHMEGEELDQAYLDAIRPLQHFPKENKAHGKELKVTYTSLHGTGISIVPKALNDWGFTTIEFVDEQIKPDGDFPTVKFPNPEFKEALALGIQHLVKTKSDILLANDPDADRMGVVVMHKNEPHILTGNEIGSLCVHFLCEILKKVDKGAFVTTIVSTELIKTIADSYGIACFEVLTGFKYIGDKIHEWEQNKNGYKFLFGAEESYGFLLGTVARDKDAIVTSCFVSEMALYFKRQGKTLVDCLNALYQKYGIFKEKQYSVLFTSGREEASQMAAFLTTLRKKPPTKIAGQKVVCIEDYLNHERHFLDSGKKELLTLPTSDVLLYRLADESKIVIRPSGTEPKIKLYAAVREKQFSTIAEGMKKCETRLDNLIATFKKELNLA